MGPAELQAYSDGYQRRINRKAWLFGLYVQDALCAVLSAAFSEKRSRNTFQYPNQPHKSLQPETEEEKKQEAENERLQARLYMHQMEHAGRNWGKSPTAPKKDNPIDDGMTKEERELLIAKIILDNERRASRNLNL